MSESPVPGSHPPSRIVLWVGRVLTVLVALLFVFSAVAKLTTGAKGTEGVPEMGIPQSMIVPLGILELVCVAVYVFPQTTVLGAILLTGYMGGAICTHWRVGDPFLFQIGIGVIIWLGIFLREPRLRELIPLRRT
ncbi:MAG: DoxX family protein [Planctomycetaceae bacterium]|nr:DoxX family protein [Planctomycetaceae bacterium]